MGRRGVDGALLRRQAVACTVALAKVIRDDTYRFRLSPAMVWTNSRTDRRILPSGN
jgi:hypothetical protein